MGSRARPGAERRAEALLDVNGSPRTRIALLDPHVTFVQALGLVLEKHGYDCPHVPLHESRRLTTHALIDHLGRSGAGIVLLNLNLGQKVDAIDLIDPIERLGCAVIVLIDTPEDVLHGECLLRGARAVLSKTGSLAALLAVIDRVETGQTVLAAVESDRLMGLASSRPSRMEVSVRSRLARLSPHEIEILRHLMSGRTVSEIARLRVVSEATVRAQVKAVLAKLETHSQVAAVAVAYRAGLGT